MTGESRFEQYKEYKELYIFELQRRGDLTKSLSIPIGIVSIIASAIFVIITQLSKPLSSIEILEFCILLISIFLLIISVFLLFKSFYNYPYGYIPTAKEIEDWRGSLVKYYIEISKNDSGILADEDITKFLISKFAEHAHRNAINNDTRSTHLHNANLFIIASIIFLFMSGGVFITESFSNAEKVYKVILVEPNNTGDNVMADETESETHGESEDAPEPTKPPPPKDRIINEEKLPPREMR